jgi:hypothetical protein
MAVPRNILLQHHQQMSPSTASSVLSFHPLKLRPLSGNIRSTLTYNPSILGTGMTLRGHLATCQRTSQTIFTFPMKNSKRLALQPAYLALPFSSLTLQRQGASNTYWNRQTTKARDPQNGTKVKMVSFAYSAIPRTFC